MISNRLVLTVLVLAIAVVSQAQTMIVRDPEIETMVSEVNADSLQSYIRAMVSFGTRSTISTVVDRKRGIGAARNWVLSKFNQIAAAANGRLTAAIDTTTYVPDGQRVKSLVNLGNVIATLKGADPNDHRIFLISGHLDSRRTDVMDATGDAPGANDDGSGSAAVIECARVMSRHSFPATIFFVVVSGEEQGLLGSGILAKKAKEQGWDIEAVLNNDIIGSNNSSETNIINNTQVRVFSEGIPYLYQDKAKSIRQMGAENDGSSRQLSRYIKEVGQRYVDNLEVVQVYRPDRFLRGGDQSPFQQQGFTAVRITEMNENYNHQHQDVRTEKGVVYGDLPEFMDFEYLRKNTAMNLSVLANLAKSAGVPQEVKVDVKNLSNGAQLSWIVPASGKPYGYYVLVRETTSPVWQKKVFTSQVSIRLPYSKDNYYFAVQSVSDHGNESLPVVPTPAR